VTGTPVLIDLGDVPRPTAPEPDPPRPERRWSARRDWTLVVAGLLALVVSTVRADGRAPALAPVATFSVTGSNFTIYGDSLYVAPLGHGGAGGPLIAYRLADRVPRWSLAASDGPFFGVQVVAGQPLAVAGSCPRLSGTDLAAFDPATGAIRWRHFGVPLGPGGAGTVLVDVPPNPFRCGGADTAGEPLPTEESSATIEAVDILTGETRWAIHPPPEAALSYLTEGGVLREVIVVDRGGQAQAIDAGTGQVLATGRIPPVLDSRSNGELVVRWHASVIGRLLLIGVRQGGELRLTAYSVDTFNPVWSRTVDLALRSTSSYTPLWDVTCGTLVCFQSPSGIVAVDGGSGEVRWRMADVGPIWSDGSALLVGSDGNPAGARLASVLRLVDPQDGATRVDLTGYNLRGVAAAQRDLFVLAGYDAGSTMFVLVDGTRGERRFLGRVPGGYERCEANHRYLACSSGLDVLRVWRMVN
jgi:hypothetical protein